MIDKKWCFASALLLVVVINSASAYKILGVIPTGAKSHYFVGHALMKGLAEKGHDVTVISPFSSKNTIKNYRDVPTPSIDGLMKGFAGQILQRRGKNIVQIFLRMYDIGVILSNATLAEPSVKKLMASGETFDVVICEVFVSEAVFGLAEHFKAPLIGLGTFGATKWNTDLVGTPSPPSYVPSTFLQLTDHMTLSQRILNLAVATFEEVYFDNFYLPRQRAIFNNYFPKSKLGLDNIRKNTSLVLLNSHFSLGYPRPYVPNMIEVGGMHINRKRKPLPDDIQKFMDEAKDGVIYFSMGSNLKSSVLPIAKREALLKTFKSLKQRVLWKFEDPSLPGKSDNVFISDWFPQDDILAHPNVKLFITHGGLLGLTEAIYHGKPVVGIPMFGDQYLNIARAESVGFGAMVNYDDLSAEIFTNTIKKVLKDPSYTIKVKEMSARYRDQPMEPLDLAIYWVEYIARHKGAPHLHSAGQDLNFLQYHNLDAILVLYGGVLLVLLVVLKVLIMLVGKFLQKPNRRPKAKKN